MKLMSFKARKKEVFIIDIFNYSYINVVLDILYMIKNICIFFNEYNKFYKI